MGIEIYFVVLLCSMGHETKSVPFIADKGVKILFMLRIFEVGLQNLNFVHNIFILGPILIR